LILIQWWRPTAVVLPVQWCDKFYLLEQWAPPLHHFSDSYQRVSKIILALFGTHLAPPLEDEHKPDGYSMFIINFK